MRSGTARSLLQSRLEKLNDGPVVRFFLFTSGCVDFFQNSAAFDDDIVFC